MTNRPDIRKRAYHCICERLNNLPAGSGEANEAFIIPLDELRLLKEGLSDTSPKMVVFVKKLFGPMVGEAEIDAHLVTPFQDKSQFPASSEALASVFGVYRSAFYSHLETYSLGVRQIGIMTQRRHSSCQGETTLRK